MKFSSSACIFLVLISCSNQKDKKFSSRVETNRNLNTQNVGAVLDAMAKKKGPGKSPLDMPIHEMMKNLTDQATDEEFYVDGKRFVGVKTMMLENADLVESLAEEYGSLREYIEAQSLLEEGGKKDFKTVTSYAETIMENSDKFSDIRELLSSGSQFSNADDFADAEEASTYAGFFLDSGKVPGAPTVCGTAEGIGSLTIPGAAVSFLSCGETAAVGAAETVATVAVSTALEAGEMGVELATVGAATPVVAGAEAATATAEASILKKIWTQVTTVCGAAVTGLFVSGAAKAGEKAFCSAPGPSSDVTERQRIDDCLKKADALKTDKAKCYPGA